MGGGPVQSNRHPFYNRIFTEAAKLKALACSQSEVDPHAEMQALGKEHLFKSIWDLRASRGFDYADWAVLSYFMFCLCF